MNWAGMGLLHWCCALCVTDLSPTPSQDSSFRVGMHGMSNKKKNSLHAAPDLCAVFTREDGVDVFGFPTILSSLDTE